MLKLLVPELSWLETPAFRFLSGSVALSLFIFFLCVVHLALKGIFPRQPVFLFFMLLSATDSPSRVDSKISGRVGCYLSRLSSLA